MDRYAVCSNPEVRHDFLLLFDVTDGNPNGDPDAGNLPRVDPETMEGLITDVCIKRKVRNYVALTRGDREGSGYEIYVNEKGIALNTLHKQAYENKNTPPAPGDDGRQFESTGKKQDIEVVNAVRARMCRRFYDVRMFGAVMTTGVNAGQVRGPVQMTFARSVSPIVPMDVTITRVAITDPKDMEVKSEDGKEAQGGKRTEIGRKPMVPYALYVARGFFSAPFARSTGVSRADLELFWEALEKMWDLDRSASRGYMACRGLYVFSHRSEVGSAPAHVLFDRLEARLREGTQAPRAFGDYVVYLNDRDLPEGVTLTRLVGDA
ncbi:MAG: type I-C CRISPR-associated protein Cas7/Csd2 [Chloroherpetonaceae bacterium]|nr:type I-C CRISPR-associated protein Cas7/Csd2 [Chloroherpetonaceae bacterium]